MAVFVCQFAVQSFALPSATVLLRQIEPHASVFAGLFTFVGGITRKARQACVRRSATTPCSCVLKLLSLGSCNTSLHMLPALLSLLTCCALPDTTALLCTNATIIACIPTVTTSSTGAGKSTLMRAIANGQVEGFPPPEELKTVYVEHDLDDSEAETVRILSCVEDMRSVLSEHVLCRWPCAVAPGVVMSYVVRHNCLRATFAATLWHHMSVLHCLSRSASS